MTDDQDTLDAVQYKNGTKNNWRRRAWNIIGEAVKDKRESSVLYLPGAANLDLPVALERGFLQRNMFCVERDKRIARYLRTNFNQTVIDENLIDVMNAWPERHPVSVVVADMVHGFERESMAVLIPWIGGAAFTNCTLLLNVMRGRERSATFRAVASLREHDWWSRVAAQWGVDEKHRGLLAIWWIKYWFARLYYSQCEPALIPDVMKEMDARGVYRGRWKFDLLPGYRSTSGQYFDTIIATDLGYDSHLRGTWRENIEHPQLDPLSKAKLEAVNRRITAAIAVRTMRRDGVLP